MKYLFVEVIKQPTHPSRMGIWNREEVSDHVFNQVYNNLGSPSLEAGFPIIQWGSGNRFILAFKENMR